MNVFSPVQIGQVVYEARVWSYGDKLVPCPVCYGKLFATLVLGNGEHVTVECEACGLGLDGPRGVINEPCAGSSVRSFAVAGFIQDGDGWKVFDYTQQSREWGSEAFATEVEAEARRAVLFEEATRDAEFRSIRRSEYLRKKPTWLVYYHRRQLIRFVRAALAARTIQDHLWGGPPGASCRPGGFDKYLDACQKRIECLRALDRTNRSWKVEARKRLLQLSTLAVSAMELIDGGCE